MWVCVFKYRYWKTIAKFHVCYFFLHTSIMLHFLEPQKGVLNRICFISNINGLYELKKVKLSSHYVCAVQCYNSWTCLKVYKNKNLELPSHCVCATWTIVSLFFFCCTNKLFLNKFTNCIWQVELLLHCIHAIEEIVPLVLVTEKSGTIVTSSVLN